MNYFNYTFDPNFNNIFSDLTSRHNKVTTFNNPRIFNTNHVKSELDTVQKMIVFKFLFNLTNPIDI